MGIGSSSGDKIGSEIGFKIGTIDESLSQVLTCTTSGLAYLSSTQAYGTWEFFIYKGGNGTTLNYNIVSDSSSLSNGYFVGPNSAERFSLNTMTGGAYSGSPFYTAVDYIALQTWYEIKVTRNSVLDEFVAGAVGTFAVYIRGGAFGSSYILIDVTGGTGTNPVTNNTYTTSTHQLLDLDATDKIADIRLNGSKVNMFNFTQTTGVYTQSYEKISL